MDGIMLQRQELIKSPFKLPNALAPQICINLHQCTTLLYYLHQYIIILSILCITILFLLYQIIPNMEFHFNCHCTWLTFTDVCSYYCLLQPTLVAVSYQVLQDLFHTSQIPPPFLVKYSYSQCFLPLRHLICSWHLVLTMLR